MEFTYEWYKLFISVAKNNYAIKQWDDPCEGIILRHDVDYDLQKACDFSLYEHELGVRSTYFILLTSDFYNIYSLNSQKYIQRILCAGHSIGLHFDETRYADDTDKDFFCEKILWEAKRLSDITGVRIDKVSMHRPSKKMLNWDIEIPGFVNTYSKYYFNNYKYFSDSRRNWRESVIEELKKRKYKNVQVLTHPFWYMSTNKEKDIHDTIVDFVNSANHEIGLAKGKWT